MNGHKFLKVTGILMIIAAAFSIIAGVFVGGLGALAAGLGACQDAAVEVYDTAQHPALHFPTGQRCF